MYFLGTITGSSGACSNAWTGPSGLGTFAIPIGTKAIYLSASQPGIMFELGQATGISFQTSAARAALLDATGIFGPFRCINADSPNAQPTVVSIYNNVGNVVSVRVYLAPTT